LSALLTSKLGFTRYRTSHCLFVLGQKYFLVLLSLCPETRAGAKIPGQNHLPKIHKTKTEKHCSIPGKVNSKTGKDVLKQEIIGNKILIVPPRPASCCGF
jgi:hypothetical protein